MTFRARIAIAAAGAVALSIVLASVTLFFIVRTQLRAPIDDGLEARAERIAHIPLNEVRSPSGETFVLLSPGFGEPGGSFQLVKADGKTIRAPFEDIKLPVGDAVLGVAKGGADRFFYDADIEGEHVRVLTVPYVPGYALQVARPLTEVDKSLRRIGFFLFLIAAVGIGAAAALGLIVSRAALAPVKRLTDTAEKVSATGDLSERIDVGGKDELSRLATSFNSMLAALEESTRAQRQLVADASHELRTPLTSLRTNIEVLAGGHVVPAEDRERLLSDVVEQVEEMSNLISELIELARTEEVVSEPEDVRLDLVAEDALERARRNRPGVRFTSDLQPSTVHGVSSTIERAIGNLLDNAAKWSPSGAEVHLEVRDGEVTVRDHGPGIDDEDLPYVFDRFYRARSARGLPGSGLGLAIVRQVAYSHGGEVVAERAEGGGTLMTLRLNGGARTPVVVGDPMVSG